MSDLKFLLCSRKVNPKSLSDQDFFNILEKVLRQTCPHFRKVIQKSQC